MVFHCSPFEIFRTMESQNCSEISQLQSLLSDLDSPTFFVLVVLLSKFGNTPKKNDDNLDAICGSDGRTYLSINEFKRSLFHNPRLQIIKLSPCNDGSYFHKPIDEGMENNIESINKGLHSALVKDDNIPSFSTLHKNDLIEIRPIGKEEAYPMRLNHDGQGLDGKDPFDVITNMKPYEKPKYEENGSNNNIGVDDGDIDHGPLDSIAKLKEPKSIGLLSDDGTLNEIGSDLNNSYPSLVTTADQVPKFNSSIVSENQYSDGNIDFDPNNSSSNLHLGPEKNGYGLEDGRFHINSSNSGEGDINSTLYLSPEQNLHGLDDSGSNANIEFHTNNEISKSYERPQQNIYFLDDSKTDSIGGDSDDKDAASKPYHEPVQNGYGLDESKHDAIEFDLNNMDEIKNQVPMQNSLDDSKINRNVSFDSKNAISENHQELNKNGDGVDSELKVIGLDHVGGDVIIKQYQKPEYSGQPLYDSKQSENISFDTNDAIGKPHEEPEKNGIGLVLDNLLSKPEFIGSDSDGRNKISKHYQEPAQNNLDDSKYKKNDFNPNDAISVHHQEPGKNVYGLDDSHFNAIGSDLDGGDAINKPYLSPEHNRYPADDSKYNKDIDFDSNDLIGKPYQGLSNNGNGLDDKNILFISGDPDYKDAIIKPSQGPEKNDGDIGFDTNEANSELYQGLKKNWFGLDGNAIITPYQGLEKYAQVLDYSKHNPIALNSKVRGAISPHYKGPKQNGLNSNWYNGKIGFNVNRKPHHGAKTGDVIFNSVQHNSKYNGEIVNSDFDDGDAFNKHYQSPKHSGHFLDDTKYNDDIGFDSNELLSNPYKWSEKYGDFLDDNNIQFIASDPDYKDATIKPSQGPEQNGYSFDGNNGNIGFHTNDANSKLYQGLKENWFGLDNSKYHVTSSYPGDEDAIFTSYQGPEQYAQVVDHTKYNPIALNPKVRGAISPHYKGPRHTGLNNNWYNGKIGFNLNRKPHHGAKTGDVIFNSVKHNGKYKGKLDFGPVITSDPRQWTNNIVHHPSMRSNPDGRIAMTKNYQVPKHNGLNGNWYNGNIGFHLNRMPYYGVRTGGYILNYKKKPFCDPLKPWWQPPDCIAFGSSIPRKRIFTPHDYDSVAKSVRAQKNSIV